MSINSLRLQQIGDLKKIYDMPLSAAHSHKLRESRIKS